jgi:hypothetical protein
MMWAFLFLCGIRVFSILTTPAENSLPFLHTMIIAGIFRKVSIDASHALAGKA